MLKNPSKAAFADGGVEVPRVTGAEPECRAKCQGGKVGRWKKSSRQQCGDKLRDEEDTMTRPPGCLPSTIEDRADVCVPYPGEGSGS